MPAYNAQDHIRTAIQSVLQQTYKNWELIVVDDCSKDNTNFIVESIMVKDSRIKLFKLDSNSGAAVARNKAIDVAKGEFIAFLDSDDVWFPDKLCNQIAFMEKNAYKFTCTAYNKINEQGVPVDRVINANTKSDYLDLLKKCPGNSTVIYDAENLGKFYIPDIRKRNDYLMWLQVIKKAKFLYGLKTPLSSHRIRKNAISSKKISLIWYHWIVYRKYEHLSLIKSCYLIVYWVVATVFRLR